MPILGSEPHAAWTIYERELRSQKLGHPMWHADPTARSGEIKLGDIGYIDRGRFHLLFNCTTGAEDTSHGTRGEVLPIPFEPFIVHKTDIEGPNPAISHGCIASKTKVSTERAGQVQGGHAGLDAGAEGKHSAQEIARASLHLHFPAVRSFLTCTGRIEEYVAKHCDTWVQSFKAKKLSRKKILFVYGFIKTSAWQATAWEQSNDEVEASVWVRVQSFAGLGGKMASKRSRAMTQRTSDDPDREVSAGGKFPKDSCIFLDVYRPLARHVMIQRLKNSLLPHAKQRSIPDIPETAEKHPAPPSRDRGPRSQKAKDVLADEVSASPRPGTQPENVISSSESPDPIQKRSQERTKTVLRGGRHALKKEKRNEQLRSHDRASPGDLHDSEGQQAPGPLEAAEDRIEARRDESGEWSDDSMTDVDDFAVEGASNRGQEESTAVDEDVHMP